MARLEYMDVYFSVQAFQEEDLRGKSAVIIDVLRAASSMVTALNNGARKIIPVGAMEDAVRIAQTMDAKDYLLCGEQNGNTIEGFHLGNSPLEYTKEVVADKTLIINTTNGTKAIKKASLANKIYVGCFLNQQSILEGLKEHDDDVVLICSGWQGKMSLEDTLFAGSVIYEMCEGKLPENTKDGVKIAFSLYEKYKENLEQSIGTSDHAIRLKELVPDGDIPFVCQKNKFDVLPTMKDGILINFNG
ncbi:2-phosphosulfolactate phosphatase [Balneola vulgaris]|jgi:2-phosphosulfolactate phosphatase|uniref:2-phosphosulfolactate phosphatase n=1 Tax=Balneola vulgaris TaxID=287535 RepID=UPI00037299CF|nr:2-phosphosulfolactate phosphatase [Balneola vulgaris]